MSAAVYEGNSSSHVLYFTVVDRHGFGERFFSFLAVETNFHVR